MSLKKYYSTHDGPWKGVKRNQQFKNSVSRTLKKVYKNGHTNWNKGKHLTQEHSLLSGGTIICEGEIPRFSIGDRLICDVDQLAGGGASIHDACLIKDRTIMEEGH